jgi:hypothetical protein
MNTDVCTIEVVNLNDLKSAPFNPPSRTDEKRLKTLERKIVQAGRVLIPIIIASQNYIADGHRRVAISRKLGYSTIIAIRYEDMTLADLWSNINGGMLSPGRTTWMQAVRMGMPVECVDNPTRRMIEDLLDIAGTSLFNELADKGRSPWIADHAKIVANYCEKHGDKKFMKKTILWFEEQESQNNTRDAMTAGCPPQVLSSAINDNRPIRQFWGVG